MKKYIQKMSKEKNLVEDALIQMRNLEEAVAENAKGILASTMKQEIKELVKESIVSERDDDDEEIVDEPETGDNEFEFPEDGDDEDFEFPDDGDNDDEDSDFSDTEDEDSYMSTGMMPDDDDDDVIDLTGTDSEGNPLIPDEDLLKVFLAMDASDGIIVKKDNNMVNLKDDNTDKEYMIQLEDFMGMRGHGEENESMDVDDEFTEDEDEGYESYEYTEDEDEGYNEFTEDEDEEYTKPMGQNNPMSQKNLNSLIDSVFSEDSDFNKKPSYDMGDEFGEGIVYEIEMEDDDDTYEVDLEEMDDIDEDDSEYLPEAMKPKIGKGARIGKPKFTYKKSSGGFKETMKTGTKGVGMGKGPKF